MPEVPLAQPDRSEQLVRLSIEGDTAALADLIRSTQGEVWRFIAHLTDPWLADDLTQETYVRALRTMRRFEGRSSFRTWLFSIARRVVIDEFRRSYRRPKADRQLGERVEVPGGESAVGFEGVVELGDLLEHLDEDRRTALVLTQVIGLSYAEAAAVCGVPVGTIRSRVARARHELILAIGD